jgi:hypothetical protein
MVLIVSSEQEEEGLNQSGCCLRCDVAASPCRCAGCAHADPTTSRAAKGEASGPDENKKTSRRPQLAVDEALEELSCPPPTRRIQLKRRGKVSRAGISTRGQSAHPFTRAAEDDLLRPLSTSPPLLLKQRTSPRLPRTRLCSFAHPHSVSFPLHLACRLFLLVLGKAPLPQRTTSRGRQRAGREATSQGGKIGQK